MNSFIFSLFFLFSLFSLFPLFSPSFNSQAVILHLSDIHFDQLYQINSSSTCLQGKFDLRCCRKDSIPIYPFRNASKWGDFNCDTPILLIQNLLLWIKENYKGHKGNKKHEENKENIIIYTGDTVAHNDISQSFMDNIQTLKDFSKLIQYYLPNITFIPTLGNHDTYPVDQMSSILHQKLFIELVDTWNIPIYSRDTFIKGGYYHRFVNNITIISLNTVYYVHNNLFNINMSDIQSREQLIWLENLIGMSKKVWIIGHVPPSSNVHVEYRKSLLNIIEKYSSVIEYTFWGHTHNDEFMLFRNNVGFISPSFMPDNHNPGVREYTSSGYIQYYIDFNTLIKYDKFIVNPLYSFNTLYNKNNLSYKSISELTGQMAVNDTLFNIYYYNYNMGIHKDCDKNCKLNIICDIYIDEYEKRECLSF